MSRDFLADLRVASPCRERWADMVGDDRARLCARCDRQVFDLSALTREQANALLAARGVTPCVRFRRRADGTVVTADCPTSARPGARRLAVIAAGAALFGASPAVGDPMDPPADVQTTGGVQGVVKDAASGERLIGATVVVSGSTLESTLAEITDENGFYSVPELPPGGYTITVHYLETTTERSNVRIGIGAPAVVIFKVALEAQGEHVIVIDGHPPPYEMGSTTVGITLDTEYLQGLPVSGRTFEDVLGAAATAREPEPAAPPPPHRPTLEWSSWIRVGYGAEEHAPNSVARVIGPQPDDRDPAWEAALGADISIPVARHGDVRLGAWMEVRTSSGPVLGAEVLVEAVPWKRGVLALRAGGNTDVVTAAIAYGHLVRLVASATRALEDPRDWSATAGLEVDPVGALRSLLGRR